MNIEEIRKNPDKVNWRDISSKKLTEEFIREFKDQVYWYGISCYQKLSENFIREFQDKVDWRFISKYQKLSENFIREFQDKVEWRWISSHQVLSEDFIIEFIDKFDNEFLMEYFKDLKLSDIRERKIPFKFFIKFYVF